MNFFFFFFLLHGTTEECNGFTSQFVQHNMHSLLAFLASTVLVSAATQLQRIQGWDVFSQMLTWNRDVYLGDLYGFKSVWCARLIKVLHVALGAGKLHKSAVTTCTLQKQPKSKQKLYKRASIVWICRSRYYARAPGAAASGDAKRRKKRRKTTSCKHRKDLSGSEARPEWHIQWTTGDERQAGNWNGLTLARVAGHAHTRPRTPYMYI